MSASSLSKTGSPKPKGIFEASTEIDAPIESPSSLNWSMYFSSVGIKDSSGQKNGFELIIFSSKLVILCSPIWLM